MPKHTIGRARGAALLAAFLLTAAPLAGQAQELNLDRAPSVGKVFAGEVPAGGGTARFLLTLAPGEAIDLTAAPVAGSDPRLRVTDAVSGELIAENDDSAGSLASNVRLYAAQGQRVRIEVSNAAIDGGDAAMRFDLIVRPSDYRPRPPVALALGDSHGGNLGRSEEQLFRFQAERGELWDLSLAAAPGSGLDPALQVFAGEAAGGEALGQDDDGGGGLNSRLRFLVPANGTYTVRVYGIGQTEGAFAFSAGRSEGALAAAVREIGLGVAATGTLGAGSGDQFYRFSEAARQAIAAGTGALLVTLDRTDDGEGGLDPMLEIGFETPLGFSTLLSDDDGGGDTNARLVFDASDLDEAWLGALRIKARAFSQSSGDYELLVSEGGAD
jgi:hypothetical protein